MNQPNKKRLWKIIGSQNTQVKNSLFKHSKMTSDSHMGVNSFVENGVHQNKNFVTSQVINEIEEIATEDKKSQEYNDTLFQLKINQNHFQQQIQHNVQQFSFSGCDSPVSHPCNLSKISSAVMMDKACGTQELIFPKFQIKNLGIELLLLKQDQNLLRDNLIQQISQFREYLQNLILEYNLAIGNILNSYEKLRIQKQELCRINQTINSQKQNIKNQLKCSQEQNNQLIIKLDQTLEKYWQNFEDKEKLKRENLNLEKTIIELQENFKNFTQGGHKSNLKVRPSKENHKYSHTLNCEQKEVTSEITQSNPASTFNSLYLNPKDSRSVFYDFQHRLNKHHQLYYKHQNSKHSLNDRIQ